MELWDTQCTKRKHTNKYLNVEPHHYPVQLSGVEKRLIYRSETLTVNDHK